MCSTKLKFCSNCSISWNTGIISVDMFLLFYEVTPAKFIETAKTPGIFLYFVLWHDAVFNMQHIPSNW